MPKAIAQKTFEDSVQWLRSNGFDVQGSGNQVTLTKYGCSAALEKNSAGIARISSYPGVIVGGEVAKLVDRGYQKFLQTSKLEIAATADSLKNLHRFAEELKEALGLTSLYNESLGSVSESYRYDRVKDRDLPASERPTRPWQQR
ncbi:MAG TPA: hypothetical protein VMT82_03920 [candidate division Zixibacteria bacterium]|nr:hypothetical protein [candidate division Zixibacteria bacterium]